MGDLYAMSTNSHIPAQINENLLDGKNKNIETVWHPDTILK